MDFQQKSKIRKYLYSPVVVGLVLLLTLYAVYSTLSVYQKYAQSRRDMAKAEAKLIELEAKSTELQEQANTLQTQAGIEEEIRAKYGVAKPDERMAVIVTDDHATTSTAEKNSSLWDKVLQFLGIE